MQPVDYTTLIAICRELQITSLPARLEQVYQRDRFTIALALRTLQGRNWLDISWHPQLARICMADPPPRQPDTFTFSQQLRHQLGGLALVAIAPITPWERVLDLQFAKRPGEEALWHLYVEIMGKYSNVILTTADQQIVTCGHQVNSRQSSVRTINTGQAYELPPSLTNSMPLLSESLDNWQARLSLIPGAILTNLLKNYRGISKNLVLLMLEHCQIDPQTTTEQLTTEDWQYLFSYWQIWLTSLETNNFSAQLTNTGYTVINWLPNHEIDQINQSVQPLINDYYTQWQNQQDFQQLRQSIKQKLQSILSKLRVKANTFQAKLQESDNCDLWRSQADLLMANLHEWQVGMQSIQLADFHSGEPVTIQLDPEKNAVANAQVFYKRHQKLKRAKEAVTPLLEAVQAEINYLEQVEAAVMQLEQDDPVNDLITLQEIQAELVQQKYLTSTDYRPPAKQDATEFRRYTSPHGYEILIGRNNRQNDLLFKIAGDYDIWFHTQEIPGSHLLLRLDAGAVLEENDLQFVANLSAYYSQARQSDVVPVVYTKPQYVYKPKGARPGMVVYQREQILWGKPQLVVEMLEKDGDKS